MGIFEEMNFSGNLDFLSAPMGEGEVLPESEHEANVEDDYSDEEMDVDELERRMWRDRMLLRRLKEQKGKEGVDSLSSASLRSKHGERKCLGPKMVS